MLHNIWRMLFSTHIIHFKSIYYSTSSFLHWRRAVGSDAVAGSLYSNRVLQPVNTSLPKTPTKDLQKSPPNLSLQLHYAWKVGCKV